MQDFEEDWSQEYLPSPEQRLNSYMEGRAVPGRPLFYDPDFCELPPEMMFMHEAVFGENDLVLGDDLWEQLKKQHEVWERKEEMWQKLNQ